MQYSASKGKLVNFEISYSNPIQPSIDRDAWENGRMTVLKTIPYVHSTN